MLYCPYPTFIFLVQGGASICEMMFCSSLVATAGSGESTTTSPRKVHIINTKVKGVFTTIFNNILFREKQ